MSVSALALARRGGAAALHAGWNVLLARERDVRAADDRRAQSLGRPLRPVASLAPGAAVAEVRETSVLLAVALGAYVLREPVGPVRVAGAALVVADVALVALG